MNRERRRGSLNGLANVIARRLEAIRILHEEQGKKPPADEMAHQFRLLCDTAQIQGGPPSTSEMEQLACELVPDAIAAMRMREERIAA
jgi:hypothetical protein